MLVTIAILHSLPESRTTWSFLRAYGVNAVLFEGHLSAEPTLVTALGGIRIKVPEEQVEQALDLLESCDPPAIMRLSLRRSLTHILTALAMFLVGGVAPPPRIAGEYLRSNGTAPLRE